MSGVLGVAPRQRNEGDQLARFLVMLLGPVQPVQQSPHLVPILVRDLVCAEELHQKDFWAVLRVHSDLLVFEQPAGVVQVGKPDAGGPCEELLTSCVSSG